MKAAAGQHDDAVDGRQQGVHDVLDPDHRDAGHADAADERRPASRIPSRSSRRRPRRAARACGRVARARASSSRLRSSERQRAGLHIGLVGELAIFEHLRRRGHRPRARAGPWRRRRRRPDSRRPSCRRTAAESETSARCQAGSAPPPTDGVMSRPSNSTRPEFGRQHAGDDAEQRRLARAVRAEHAECFTFGKLEDRGRRR